MPTGVTTAGRRPIVLGLRVALKGELLRGVPYSLSIETVRTRCHAESSSNNEEEGKWDGPLGVPSRMSEGSEKGVLFPFRKSWLSSKSSLSLLAISFDTMLAIPSNNSTPSFSFWSCGRR